MTTRIAHDGDGLPAATADPRQTPSPAARLAQARQKIGAPFWPAAHTSLRKEVFAEERSSNVFSRSRGLCSWGRSHHFFSFHS
jgi:hypothetical protein